MPNAALFVSPGPLVDGSGNPYAFSKLNFYTTGTAARLNTYSDSGLLSANTNSVVADINGKFGPIYLLANTSYKVVFATSADVTIWTWDPVQGISISVAPSVGLLRSYLSGLTLSRNVGTPNTKIDVAAGACADSTNVLAMLVPAGTIDCGTVGLNGLDTGILVLSTTYHMFVIAKVDGTVGLLASTSATSPALPSGYTLFRCIGRVLTDASVHFLPFVQDGDNFRLLTRVPSINAVNPGISAVTALLVSIPTGVRVEAVIWVGGTATQDGHGFVGLVTDISTTDETPTVSLANFGSLAAINTGTNSWVSAGELRVFTNTSAQVRYRINNSGATSTVKITTVGWIDRRGRDA